MSIRAGIYVRVSTDEQRDYGYSIDNQIRNLEEYCHKNNYEIIGIYNDAGHSGKDLFRPAMQKMLEDIKSGKVDRLIAIKVDRLTRNGYDGYWLLNYCEEHNTKIELSLEPYDVTTDLIDIGKDTSKEKAIFNIAGIKDYRNKDRDNDISI